MKGAYYSRETGPWRTESLENGQISTLGNGKSGRSRTVKNVLGGLRVAGESAAQCLGTRVGFLEPPLFPGDNPLRKPLDSPMPNQSD
jgi:hypothetical protein